MNKNFVRARTRQMQRKKVDKATDKNNGIKNDAKTNPREEVIMKRTSPMNVTLVVFFIAMGIGYFASTWIKQEDPLVKWRKEIQPQYPFITGQVKRIVLDDPEDFDDEFALDVVNKGEPVIIRNTPADQWRAMKVWSPKYIEKKVKTMHGVQHHYNRTFTYFKNDHPLSHIPGIIDEYQKNTFGRVNMTSTEFFKKVSNPPFKEYFYYTASANDFGDLYNDFYPLEPFMIKNSSYKVEESHLHRWTNVWIGPGGATTFSHYDIFYNFYVQLYGKKRFVLFSPDQASNLYLFPFLHPGAQQSQVDIDNINYEAFPAFKNAKAIEAILEPGDVLYLPPMWFHHVSALELSMSVSVWTFVNESRSMHGVMRKPLPLKKSWTHEQFVLASRQYLEQLIDTIYGTGSAKEFVQRVYEERFKTLVKSLPHLLVGQNKFCYKSLGTDDDRALKFLDPVRADFDEFLNDAASKFKAIKLKATRDIWLGNFCEQLAFTATNDAKDVAGFLLDFVNSIPGSVSICQE